ncbi:MAG: response regulator, partial [Pyrinomonadaceae bacterium]
MLSHKPRILFIDDDFDTCTLLAMFFERKGFGVRMAASADQAFALMREVGFDLYVVDSRLPDVSGFDLCRFIRGI